MNNKKDEKTFQNMDYREVGELYDQFHDKHIAPAFQMGSTQEVPDADQLRSQFVKYLWDEHKIPSNDSLG